MKTPKNDKERMIRLLETHDMLEEILSGMKPLFGELCCQGLLHLIMDNISRLIESYTEFPSMDEDDKCDWFYEIFEDMDISVENRAKELMREK